MEDSEGFAHFTEDIARCVSSFFYWLKTWLDLSFPGSHYPLCFSQRLLSAIAGTNGKYCSGEFYAMLFTGRYHEQPKST